MERGIPEAELMAGTDDLLGGSLVVLETWLKRPERV